MQKNIVYITKATDGNDKKVQKKKKTEKRVEFLKKKVYTINMLSVES